MNFQMNDLVTNIYTELKNEQPIVISNLRSVIYCQPKPMMVTLKQVWLNLISNAIKYTKLKAKTIIELGSRNEW